MLRWRLALIVSASIAISYLDRQTLPVAIQAIEQDIPVTTGQFSLLQSAFLVAYAVMYAGGGKLMDVLDRARKIALAFSAAVMPAVRLIPNVPVGWARSDVGASHATGGALRWHHCCLCSRCQPSG
jgi:sugar phosphate permease